MKKIVLLFFLFMSIPLLAFAARCEIDMYGQYLDPVCAVGATCSCDVNGSFTGNFFGNVTQMYLSERVAAGSLSCPTPQYDPVTFGYTGPFLADWMPEYAVAGPFLPAYEVDFPIINYWWWGVAGPDSHYGDYNKCSSLFVAYNGGFRCAGYYMNNDCPCEATLDLTKTVQIATIENVYVTSDDLCSRGYYTSIGATSCNSAMNLPVCTGAPGELKINGICLYPDNTFVGCPPDMYMDWWYEVYKGVIEFQSYWYVITDQGQYYYFDIGEYQKLVNGSWLPIEGLQDVYELSSIEDLQKLPCNVPLRYVASYQVFPGMSFISPTFTREAFSLVDFISTDFPLQYETYGYTEKYCDYDSGTHLVSCVYSFDVEVYQGSWDYFNGTSVFEKIGSTYQSIPPTEGDLSVYDVWDVPDTLQNRKFKFEIPINSVSYPIFFNVTDRCQPISDYSGSGQIHKGVRKKEKIRSHKGIGVYERRL